MLVGRRLVEWLPDPAGACARSPGAHRNARVRNVAHTTSGARETYACGCSARFSSPSSSLSTDCRQGAVDNLSTVDSLAQKTTTLGGAG